MIGADLLRELRLAIVVGLLLAGGAAAVGWHTWGRWEALERAQQDARQGRSQARSAIDRLRGEIADAKLYSARYQGLVSAGIAAPLRKTVTVDRIDTVVRAWPGELGTFSLGAQAPYTPAAPAGMPAPSLTRHQAFVSRLTVELTPRHDTRFLHGVAQLATAVGGLSAVERCRLSREEQGGFKGRCTLGLHGFVPLASAAQNGAPAMAGPLAAAPAGGPSGAAPLGAAAGGAGAARPASLAVDTAPLPPEPSWRSLPWPELGRLFLTEAQRREIDLGPANAGLVAEAPPLRVDGVMVRSGGRAAVWLDGKRTPVDPASADAPARLDGDRVLLRGADGQPVRVRPGEKAAP